MLQRFATLFLLLISLAILPTTKFVVAQAIKRDTSIAPKPIKDTVIRGVQYPLYRGAKGGMYIIRTSKVTGKEYKQYLKKQ